MTRRRGQIIFIGAFPPPLHGMALVSEAMVAALGTHVDVRVLPIRPRKLGGGIDQHIVKAATAIRALVGIVVARARGSRLLYAAVDDGLGGLWTLLCVSLGRMLGLRIYLHHHSYRYLLARSRLMGAIVVTAGPKACHIVLCHEMAEDFERLYGRARRFAVTPNMVEPALPRRRADPARPMTIGLLSNLTPEKGAAEFIAILEDARARGLNVQGLLAGPAHDGGLEELIRAKCAALGGALRWLGPVGGAEKEAFFASVDLFVFPTRYRTESFGLVLLEALIRGVPVIAPRRGCICVFEPLRAARIVSLDDDFCREAVSWIEQLCRDESEREALSRLAAMEGANLNRAFEDSRSKLIQEMVEATGHP